MDDVVVSCFFVYRSLSARQITSLTAHLPLPSFTAPNFHLIRSSALTAYIQNLTALITIIKMPEFPLGSPSLSGVSLAFSSSPDTSQQKTSESSAPTSSSTGAREGTEPSVDYNKLAMSVILCTGK